MSRIIGASDPPERAGGVKARKTTASTSTRSASSQPAMPIPSSLNVLSLRPGDHPDGRSSSTRVATAFIESAASPEVPGARIETRLEIGDGTGHRLRHPRELLGEPVEGDRRARKVACGRIEAVTDPRERLGTEHGRGLCIGELAL